MPGKPVVCMRQSGSRDTRTFRTSDVTIDVTCTTRLQSCVDSLVIERNWKLSQLHKKTTDYSKGELEKYLEKIEESTEGASNFRELSLDKEYKAIKEFLDESDELEEILDT